ncbi:MAG: PDZ domain-containing protein [Desulfobacteraceae bacterium]|nr:PDZ domain-containing protein [Desulfobacteraceae bacterium]
MRILILVFVIFFTCTTGLLASNDRILIEAKVNGKDVLLAFDSGSTHTILFDKAAKRINLKLIDSSLEQISGSGEAKLATSEKCSFTLGNSTVTTQLKIFKAPDLVSKDIDGVLAWGDIQSNPIRIDVKNNRIIKLDRLPKCFTKWKKWTLKQDEQLLAFYSSQSKDTMIYIDTGSAGGIELNQKRWGKWQKDNINKPRTLSARYYPADGIVINELFWANTLSIGDFTFKDIPVESAPPFREALKDCDATLGLFALSGFDIICDGEGSIYTKPIEKTEKKYLYNKIGAVFVPENMQSEYLIAHVLKESPAWKAGVRDNDILVAIDNIDATKWRTDPRVLSLSRFSEQPAGTQVDIALFRDKKIFEAKVKVEDLLGDIY